jgi:hypothetical protein
VRPQIFIRVFNPNALVKQGWLSSNDGQPGPLPRKHHQSPLMTHFGELGTPLVKTPPKIRLTLLCHRELLRVLQISPKYFKISQCKSCVVCWGTQLSRWVAFDIWSANFWKSLVNAHWHYSQAPENSYVGIQIVHNWLRKIPYTICGSCRGMGDLQLC